MLFRKRRVGRSSRWKLQFWKLQFSNVKPDACDELLLAGYTPEWTHRHGGRRGRRVDAEIAGCPHVLQTHGAIAFHCHPDPHRSSPDGLDLRRTWWPWSSRLPCSKISSAHRHSAPALLTSGARGVRRGGGGLGEASHRSHPPIPFLQTTSLRSMPRRAPSLVWVMFTHAHFATLGLNFTTKLSIVRARRIRAPA